jgi:hypothetical protein
MPGYFQYLDQATANLSLSLKCEACDNVFHYKWTFHTKVAVDHLRSGIAWARARQTAEQKRRRIEIALQKGSFIRRCPQCNFTPLCVATPFRERALHQSEIAHGVIYGGAVFAVTLWLAIATSSVLCGCLVVLATPSAAWLGYWRALKEKHAAEASADYPNDQWAASRNRVVPRDKVYEPIWTYCDRPETVVDEEWPLESDRATEYDLSTMVAGAGGATSVHPETMQNIGDMSETLASGGHLVVTTRGWWISYHFPGPDRRYNGRDMTIQGKDVCRTIRALQRNWREYQRLKAELPPGVEHSKHGAMYMSINIGGHAEGVCLDSDWRIRTEDDLKKAVDSFEFALSRVPQLLQTLFKTMNARGGLSQHDQAEGGENRRTG